MDFVFKNKIDKPFVLTEKFILYKIALKQCPASLTTNCFVIEPEIINASFPGMGACGCG